MGTDLRVLRQQIRPLLDLADPRDGLFAYYALYHAPQRTRLFVEGRGEKATGFLAVCQTGRDLFSSLAALRAPDTREALRLLQRGLIPGRPYYLVTTLELRSVAEWALQGESTAVNLVYQLNPRRYTPSVNIMVTPARAADGSPRFVIRPKGDNLVAAEAGMNWQSPHFAEVYVRTAPQAQRRGWGEAVLNACVAWVLRSGTRPLYVVEEGNAPSIRLAESVGFEHTGAHEFTIEGIARPRTKGAG